MICSHENINEDDKQIWCEDCGEELTGILDEPTYLRNIKLLEDVEPII